MRCDCGDAECAWCGTAQDTRGAPRCPRCLTTHLDIVGCPSGRCAYCDRPMAGVAPGSSGLCAKCRPMARAEAGLPPEANSEEEEES